MPRIRIGAPLSLAILAGCIAGTYLPGATWFGLSGNLSALMVPLTWLRLFMWPLVHAGTAHLLANIMLFLLLAPALEKRQGPWEFLGCLAATAAVIGLAHLSFGGGHVLVGASGWVFMMIILSTFTSDEPGVVALPTLIVAVLYGVQELRAAFEASNVSHFAHFLGGACGFAFGLLGSGRRDGAQSG